MMYLTRYGSAGRWSRRCAAAAVCAALLGGAAAARPAGKHHAPSPATCEEHLKQLGTAFARYLRDHKGVLPPAASWTDALRPYLHGGSALRCPEDTSGAPASYAMNANLGGKALKKEESWHRVLLFESTAGARNHADTGGSLCSPPRHQGGSYYLFADGSVELREQPAPF